MNSGRGFKTFRAKKREEQRRSGAGRLNIDFYRVVSGHPGQVLSEKGRKRRWAADE